MFDKSYIDRMFAIYPTFRSLLRESKNVKMARFFISSYLDELVQVLNTDKSKIQPLEWALQTSCLLAFRRIISIRGERVVNYSLLRLLWLLANEQYDELPDDLNDGFFEEMLHLFRGMKGESHIYDQDSYPKFMDMEGREAAVVRSDQLDEMAGRTNAYTKRYKSGLADAVREIRRENRDRILSHFNASEADWNDYEWQLKHVIRDADRLGKLVQLTDGEQQAIAAAKKAKLPFGITPFYASLMDYEPHRNHDHAVRAQVIPPINYVDAMSQKAGDDCMHSFDFMMEHDTSPIDLITRRYPNIAILKPYNTCSQVCVYCQRNWEIDDVLIPEAMAPREKIDAAIDWIAERPGLIEILVTGGDPLVMQNEQIEYVLSRLAKIEHVERIRIGSRTPVVMPQRVTDDLADLIARYHEPGRREIVLVTHFEHTYEITPEAMQAVQQFKRRGMSVYNQTVFTIENSRKYELTTLRRLLRLIGVDPYYTFNTKGKEETRSYRVPMARLQQEVKEEARLAPGLVRTDEPVYNVPKLGKNYVRAQQHHTLISILPNGSRAYEFHPWEKKLSLAETFIDYDVSIYDYLKELEQRGENIEDYKTIWYYF